MSVGEIRKREKGSIGKSYALSGNKNIALWREAYSEFPNDMTVNEGLMYALYGADDEAYHDGALALGERILRESTDEWQRSSAIQILCLIHNRRGNQEKAKEYAQMASDIHRGKDALLSHILEGEAGTEHNRQLLLDCLDIIGDAEFAPCQSGSEERTMQLHEFYLKLLALYFDDGFYGIYAFYVMQRYQALARLYLSCRKDEQKAFAL